MSTKENLMGLGMPSSLANRLGRTPFLVTAAGTTIADAVSVPGTSYDLYVNATNGGTGLVLKSPASLGSGVLLGDMYCISNMLAASVYLYIRNALIQFSGISVSGSGGVSVGTGQCFFAQPISASTWRIMGSVLSA